MTIVHALIHGLPLALYGIVAFWTAASRRHWFVRTAVALAAISAPLLIPAYDLVLEGAVEATVIVIGLTIWRHWPDHHPSSANRSKLLHSFSPRVSLRDALLFTVAIAVATTIVAQLPWFNLYELRVRTGIGVIAACSVFLGVWLVVGRRYLLVRVVMTPILLLTVLWLELLEHIIFERVVYGLKRTDYWQQAFSFDELMSWGADRIYAIAVPLSIATAYVLLMVEAGWLDRFHHPTKESTNHSPTSTVAQQRRLVARTMLVTATVVAAVVSTYLLDKLSMSTPYPKVTKTAGYIEVVAAGQMLVNADLDWPKKWFELTDAQLLQITRRFKPALERVHKALAGGDCDFPFTDPYIENDRSSESAALSRLSRVMGSLSGIDRVHDVLPPTERLGVALDLLRLAESENHGNGVHIVNSNDFQSDDTIYEIADCATQLDAVQLKELANTLWKLESMHERWENQLRRERIISENFFGWIGRMEWIIDDWLGRNRFAEEECEYLIKRLAVRLLSFELAIQAYRLEVGMLPGSVTELVPRYLPAIPNDPFTDRSIMYRRKGNSHEIYSVGPDGKDDGGKAPADGLREKKGDLTFKGLFNRLLGTAEWDKMYESPDRSLPADDMTDAVTR